jgi:regulator of protease activity HflC (stomatin/prohibitin superfamily)
MIILLGDAKTVHSFKLFKKEKFMYKFILLVVVTSLVFAGLSIYDSANLQLKREAHINQFNKPITNELMVDSQVRSACWSLSVVGVVLMWITAYRSKLKYLKSLFPLVVLFFISGCRKPFEPNKYEMVEPNEVAFIINNADVQNQAAISAEEYEKKVVLSQQVKIPQMWVDRGYNTFAWFKGWNGEWIDAAKLIRVATEPVTREWTADTKSGTSQFDQAIWVMTSDQVEFSTGWTCTAYIKSREDAALFLSTYKNGSLASVLDSEIRAKLQSEFSLAVTDKPMDELKSKATPIIREVTKNITDFFALRGITITNLGITGGFVYRNPKIQEKMAEVFNAEQESFIAIAKTTAQLEENKRIQLEAEAKAKAILTEKQGEADAIKLVADAKTYEAEQAKKDTELYLGLKRLELETKKVEKWNGSFPTYFMGNGNMDLLLQIPEK